MIVHRLPYLRTDKDAAGRQTHIRAPGVPVAILGFDPGTSRDVDGQRVVTPPTLYVPYDQAVHRLDQWRIQGDLYDVDGDPARWRHGRSGRKAGTVIHLRRATG